jgi:hypothetical protein
MYGMIVLTRLLAGLIYLAAAVVWAALMGLSAILKCDDACSANGDWTDHVDAWQYDAILWLGLAGLALALVVLLLRLGRPSLARPVFGLHVGLFIVNAVILLAGRDPVPDLYSLIVLASFAAGAGFFAVGGGRSSTPVGVV